jgi:glycosyltransferase involved in cell wall biosynthesis
METVVDGETGFLVPTDEKNKDESTKRFADALWYLIQNPQEAIRMGKLGHLHVKKNFGLDEFRCQWTQIVNETIQRGRLRRELWKSTFLVRLLLFLIPLVYYIYKKI